MKKYELYYATKQGWTSLRRHPILLLSSISTIMLMLFLLSVLVSFSLNANHLSRVIGQQPPVEIMMAPGAQEESVEYVEYLLSEDERVIDYVKYTPRENFNNFKKNLEKNEIFDEEVYLQHIPYTFTVRLSDPRLAESFKQEMVKVKSVAAVDLEHELMSFLNAANRTIKTIGIIAFLVLFVIAIFVVSNMVRVVALARSEEITIMKYVGATNKYITIPFQIEGFVAGLFGALLATVAGGLLYSYVYNSVVKTGSLSGSMQDLQLLSVPYVIGMVLLVNLFIGTVLCVIISTLAVRKHVKV